MTGTPTDPNATPADSTAAAGLTQPCGTALKSIHIDIGWTFSSGAPNGRYKLTVGGQDFEGDLANGQIRIDRRLPCDTGNGRLVITVTNGPVFDAEVKLDLPPIQTPQGLLRRLTNLGFYAGVDGVYDGRARWAVRAFKRAKMNDYERAKREPENDTATQAFLTAVQAAYGEHPGDQVGADLALGAVTANSVPCGMFGSRVCRRGSFQTAGAADDRDPNPPGDGGRWEGETAAGVPEKIAGIYPLHLRAFDSSAGEAAINNRVRLPQPIHMTQFVLFELGYWMVHGADGWTPQSGTQTRKTYRPNGRFERMTQWALRELQCHAKMPKAAVEDVASQEGRYLTRLFTKPAVALTGAARYPDDGRVSGALNPATRDALQSWADGVLRCPVVVYASTDGPGGGVNLARVAKENIWLYNDNPSSAERMFAIDFSENYTLPAAYGGTVTSGGFTFPRPVVVGDYVVDPNSDSGPRAIPPNHTWAGADVEVTPENTLGRGGSTGEGLSAAELSTFKVVRTAAHFENFAFFDCVNAYDDVTISFGPCHWTLAVCIGAGAPDQKREMPAFLAYFRSAYDASYQTYFGRFGFFPESSWPIAMADETGTYASRIQMQTEGDNVVLCGLSGEPGQRRDENRYGKTWHVFYRFQMACRVSDDMRLAMWDFTRIRINDILNKTFTVAGTPRRVGDYITSEKGVAMLLRWHIFRPGHLFRTDDNYLRPVIASGNATASEARETAMLQSLSAAGAPRTNNHLSEIHGWTRVPQAPLRSYYTLNLTNPTLSGALNSFVFAEV
jgi:hypothetical protein